MAALLALAACGGGETDVRSALQGDVRLRADVDSTSDDQSGFEVLVADREGGRLDTLGFAVTDRAGTFEMAIRAPERGVYPLIISRGGPPLSMDELVVAEGDTARLRIELPAGRRPLRIRSAENSAWGAYGNTKAQHNQALVEAARTSAADTTDVGGGGLTSAELARRVSQTSALLWSLRESFPGTFAAELASAEAVTLLEGWNDSLLIARAAEIGPENPGFVNVVRALRRAVARQEGQAEAVAAVHAALEGTDVQEERAALRAELVRAYVDSLDVREAAEAAHALRARHRGTSWAAWADRTLYELGNLMPGMEAPGLAVVTAEGEPVALDSLRGRAVVLEFYRPTNPTFQRELGLRQALYQTAQAQGAALTLLSISLEPDTLVNEALFEGRHIPGLHAYAPGGLGGPIARLYNVGALPTRYLIGPTGTIAGKYPGGMMPALYQDALALLGLTPPPDALAPPAADSTVALDGRPE